MTKCGVCYAWKASHWEGWHYVDTSAPCAVHGCDKSRDDTCAQGSIVPPKPQAVVVPKKSSAPAEFPKFEADAPVLFEHQREAVDMFDDSSEVALFMEMGCGKSATVLEIVARKVQRGEVDALLIVAPNGVHVQWYREQLVQWFSVPYQAQCLFGRGGQKVAWRFDDDPELVQVVCVNIDTFSTPQKWRDIVDWANSRKTFIVLDEATCIKNVSAQRTQRLLYEFNKTLRKGKTIVASQSLSAGRAILTGTPVTNGPMDLWAMMEFIRPNFFGRNWYSFQSYYGMFTRMSVGDREINVPLTQDWWEAIKKCGTYGEAYAICGCTEDTYNTVHSQDAYVGPYKHAEELREKLHEVAYFKLLVDCVDMPPQAYNTKRLVMSDEQRECYDSMVDEYIAEYEGHTATALNKLGVITRLAQISSGFIVDKTLEADEQPTEDDPNTALIHRMFGFDEDYDITPSDPVKWIGSSNPKIEALMRDIDESAKPVIVVTRFTVEAARIFDELSTKYNTCLVTGWKRVGTIESFKEGKHQVMVANIAAIARGFNLQNSCSMLFYSNTFSLELRLQVEGRIFRLGQSHPCEYVDYVFEDSVDEKIVSALVMKRELLDYIRSSDVEEMLR